MPGHGRRSTIPPRAGCSCCSRARMTARRNSMAQLELRRRRMCSECSWNEQVESGRSAGAAVREVPKTAPADLLVQSPARDASHRAAALLFPPQASSARRRRSLRLGDRSRSTRPMLGDGARSSDPLGQHIGDIVPPGGYVPGPSSTAIELADVARPGIALQASQGGDLDPHGRPRPGTVTGEKMPDQRHDILPPLPQRRHVDMLRVDAVEKVLSKARLRQPILQILVRGRYDAHVHRRSTLSPMRRIFASCSTRSSLTC